MIDFSAIITAAATTVLAILTAVYVRLTKHMLEETRTSRGPNLYVDVEVTAYEIKLIVGNSGASPAQNIQFIVSDSIPWRKKQPHGGFKTLIVIKDGISYLAPGRVLKYIAGYYDWKELIKSNSNAEFIITFEDQTKKKHRLEFLIDMGQYKEVLFESFRKPEAEIAEAIEKMERSKSLKETAGQFFHGIGKKNCPHCDERISVSAKKCPHCHEFLDGKENKENP